MKIFPVLVSMCLLNFAVAVDSAPRNVRAIAQGPGADNASEPFALNIGVRLVEIPVSVHSAGGAMTVDNLQKSSFEVFEDGVAQDITLFKHEDIPLRMGLVFRVGTLPERRQRIQSVANSFIQESNPSNKTFVLDFDASTYYRNPQFNQGISEMVESFVDIPGRNTGIDPNTKKAVLVIANVDGIDNSFPCCGIGTLMNYFQESNDVTIYACGLQSENGKPAAKAIRERISQIAEKTGGEAYFPASENELRDITRRIAHALRNRYTLGYSPKNLKTDGTWRTIRVSVHSNSWDRPIVRAKQGYFAPKE